MISSPLLKGIFLFSNCLWIALCEWSQKTKGYRNVLIRRCGNPNKIRATKYTVLKMVFIYKCNVLKWTINMYEILILIVKMSQIQKNTLIENVSVSCTNLFMHSMFEWISLMCVQVMFQAKKIYYFSLFVKQKYFFIYN